MRYLIIIILFSFFSCQRGEVREYTPYLNHNDTVRYVGKEQCRMCHVEIYDSYMKTGMGKSLNYAIQEHSALTHSKMLGVHDSIKNLFYKPFWKDDSLYLKEFRCNGIDTTHMLIKKVKYKIGSGHHTNSHLYEINGYLYQMPYTYYTQDSIADLPPGFEHGYNTRFDRQIGIECMSCHNAYPDHEERSLNKYHAIPDGIDCERCHGPGEIHVKKKLAGEIIDTSKYIDYSIVNPAKLPLDLQFDVCQRCHLQGIAVLHEGASFTDFKPGMHLKDVMDVYLPKYENDESFIMASHVDRLKQSECYKNADLTCTSCHNPHKSVTSLSKDYFDNKCQQCHNNDCKEEEMSDCASCHMPRSKSNDIMHVSITDHKIGVHKETNIKDRNFLGLFSINNPETTPLSKAKAYLKQYESFEQKEFFLDSAFYYLNKSQNNFTSYIQYFYLKGDENGLIEYALNNIDLDTNLYSNSELALSYSRIGEFLATNEMNIGAYNYYNKSIQLMPFIIEYQIKYAAFLIKNNRNVLAAEVLNNILSLNPMIKEAYLNLGYLEMINNEYVSAANSFKNAISLDPDYILAYENLVVLAKIQNKPLLIKYYSKKILEINPDHSLNMIIKEL